MGLSLIIQIICILWGEISINTGKQKEEKRSHQEAYCLAISMAKVLGYFLLDFSR